MKFISPLKVPVSKSKFFILNINHYRNTHYHVLNKAKIAYKEHMNEQIKDIPVLSCVKIKYTLYPGTKRRTDTSNVLSIHDKFFADALVENGKLEDDSYLFVTGTEYLFGGVDKKNPRVEIEVYSDPGLDYFTGHDIF